MPKHGAYNAGEKMVAMDRCIQLGASLLMHLLGLANWSSQSSMQVIVH